MDMHYSRNMQNKKNCNWFQYEQTRLVQKHKKKPSLQLLLNTETVKLF